MKILIEPYDLRRTKEGILLLIAIKHGSTDIESYRVEQIQEIKISTIPFKPQYFVSLTPLKAKTETVRTQKQW